MFILIRDYMKTPMIKLINFLKITPQDLLFDEYKTA